MRACMLKYLSACVCALVIMAGAAVAPTGLGAGTTEEPSPLCLATNLSFKPYFLLGNYYIITKQNFHTMSNMMVLPESRRATTRNSGRVKNASGWQGMQISMLSSMESTYLGALCAFCPVIIYTERLMWI